MGGLDFGIGMKPCKWCKRQLEQRARWRSRRFCNNWCRVRYRVARTVEAVLDNV